MSHTNLHDASLFLAIQLQREELEDLKESRKRKYREGEIPDAELAIDACECELNAFETLISDRKMGLSFARAVLNDADAIHAAQVEENQAVQDRQLALRLHDGRSEPPRKAPGESSGKPLAKPALIPPVLDGCLQGHEALYASLFEDTSPSQPESSEMGMSRQVFPVKALDLPRSRCIGCQDEYPSSDIAKCPCSHDYCRDCLAGLLEASLSDESLFPPRCCRKPIPIDCALLPPALVGRFLAKKLEFDTPWPERTYCNSPTCSLFIPSQFVRGRIAFCVRCPERTCTHCKQSAHGDECTHDPAYQEVLRLAKKNGWQQCKSCKRVVELEHGCNHITCRCGAHFCYVCGLAWKTCRCAQWDEDRLIARATEIADRNVRANRTQRTNARDVMQHIVEHHDCIEHRWRSVQGAAICDECYDELPLFIYECRDCNTQACRACRYNRL